ncbi:MAG: polysaccharide biosynthesis tyrosine autokinase [Gemmatimonadota bacterium]
MAPTPAAPPAQPAYAAAGAPIPQPDYAPPGYMDEAYYPDMDSGSGIDLRRYVFAILRYKWLLVASLLVGLGGAYLAWTRTPVTYTAEGNLWIEVENRRGGAGDVAPIRPSGLLESNGWIELLRSYQVLDTVAVRERLLVQAPSEYAPAFEQFSLQMERFLPGGYELVVGQSGADYALSTAEGQLVQSGQFGAPIGENVGFVWNPARGSFPAEALVQFSVLSARDAAMSLNSRIDARMDRGGNFMSLTMSGRNPEQIASILNAVMDRHVEVAADMQSSKLRETLAILEEQLNIVSDSLDRAERDLQAWRVNTIAMPTDQSMPIAPGLEITRDPVFGNFFDMQVQVQEISRDRSRLQAVADGFGEEPVRIEALEMIPAAAASSELSQILGDLVDVRSELRSLRDRYTDDYGPIQDLRAQIRSIEEEAVPRVVNGLMAALETRQQELEGFVNQAARELEAIPPRTIEEGRLERRVLATENLYNDLRGRVESAQLAARSSIPSVRPLDRAATPRRPSQDRRLPLAAAILFGCVGAAMGGALLLDRLDARYRYASDVSRDIGLDILGSIPRIESTKGRRGVINAAQALEAFRELRIHIGFAYGNAGPITLAITSPSEGEGKSLISSNLAVAFSEVGRRTLLIDGDTRRGDAHRLLGRERSPGLIDYLRERSVGDIIQATEHPNLDFVGSGSRGVSTPELLASPRMAYFVGTLKRTYDVIIIDCPPLASGGDPLILGSLTGHLAVVIRTGSTEKLLAQAKIDQLSRLPVRILGAILNDVSAADSYHSYYASYLPSYEPVPEGDDVDPTQLLGEGAPAQDE